MRHHRAAATVSAAVREAAEAITALRDDLWRAVDAKVRATLAVDSGHRSSARGLAGCGAHRHPPERETVRRQASSSTSRLNHSWTTTIRLGWLGAMRAVGAEVASAYAAAIDRVRAGPDAVFEVPGDLGPQWTAPVAARTRGGRRRSPRGEAARVAALDPLPSPVAARPDHPPLSRLPSRAACAVRRRRVPAPPLPAAAEAPLAAPAPPSLPSSPLGDLGGMPSMGTRSSGSGLSGFGQQLADLIGGLTGSADDAVAGPRPTRPRPDDQPFDERIRQGRTGSRRRRGSTRHRAGADRPGRRRAGRPHCARGPNRRRTRGAVRTTTDANARPTAGARAPAGAGRRRGDRPSRRRARLPPTSFRRSGSSVRLRLHRPNPRTIVTVGQGIGGIAASTPPT